MSPDALSEPSTFTTRAGETVQRFVECEPCEGHGDCPGCDGEEGGCHFCAFSGVCFFCAGTGEIDVARIARLTPATPEDPTP